MWNVLENSKKVFIFFNFSITPLTDIRLCAQIDSELRNKFCVCVRAQKELRVCVKNNAIWGAPYNLLLRVK